MGVAHEPKSLRVGRANSFTNFCSHARSNHSEAALVVTNHKAVCEALATLRDTPLTARVKRTVALLIALQLIGI